MAEIIPQKSDYISFETLAVGASAETLSSAGATIPQNTGDIVVFVPSGDSMHWLGSVTPTTSLGNKITLGHPGVIPHHIQKRAKFVSDDGSDVTVCLVYKRGSGRQDLAHTKSEPF
jgi:hypothetical protein